LNLCMSSIMKKLGLKRYEKNDRREDYSILLILQLIKMYRFFEDRDTVIYVEGQLHLKPVVFALVIK
jgi:hypothetical protein